VLAWRIGHHNSSGVPPDEKVRGGSGAYRLTRSQVLSCVGAYGAQHMTPGGNAPCQNQLLLMREGNTHRSRKHWHQRWQWPWPATSPEALQGLRRRQWLCSCSILTRRQPKQEQCPLRMPWPRPLRWHWLTHSRRHDHMRRSPRKHRPSPAAHAVKSRLAERCCLQVMGVIGVDQVESRIKAKHMSVIADKWVTAIQQRMCSVTLQCPASYFLDHVACRIPAVAPG
jgi:hypothetical protein